MTNIIQNLKTGILMLFFTALALASPSYGQSLDLAVYAVKGFEGRGSLEFSSPEDIVITTDGRIIVADNKNNRLQILNKEGDFLAFVPQVQADIVIGSAKADEARNSFDELQAVLKGPTGLALDREGRLFVSCQQTHKIAIIDFEKQQLLGTLGSQGSKQGDLNSPMDIDINSEGMLAVAEWRNKRVQILSQQGECLKELVYNEEVRKGRYTAVAPRGVHWAPDGNLLVTYPLYNQVVCWSPEAGEIVWRYGIKGRERGMLYNPSYITDGLEGHFLITDSLNHRVVQITSDGKYFENYSIRKGSAPGRLISPRGIALTSEQSLVIADQGNNRIHFFHPGQVTMMLREVMSFALSDDWTAAMPQIERILYMQPNNKEARDLMVNALYYFGDQALESGDYSRADEFYRRVLRYRPDDPNIPQRLDTIFWGANQGLIANVVFGIIAFIALLVILWIMKFLIFRFIFSS